MAIGNNFRTFVNGLRLKPIDSQQNPQDETGIDVEGLLYIYADKMKIYVEAAIREVVTADQVQTLTNKTLTSPKINEDVVLTATSTDLNQLTGATLITPDSTTTFTNKTIDADNNTISNIDNDEIKAAAGIVESKLALDYATDDLNTNISDHIADTADAHAASAITNTPSGNLAATEVQGALNELQSDIDSKGTDLSDHISDTTTHGTTGAIVGTTDTQTLTGKAIDADNNTISNLAHGTEVDNPSSGVHGATGSIVGTTDTQTLTNKTFDDAVTIQEIATPSTPASGYKKLYPKTDNKLYTLDDAGNEVEVGSGGGAGGINYLEGDNSDAELTVGDWLAYADAAGTRPVDGTGGTPTTTFTRTTTDPLRGNGSFLLTKDAANRQGEGGACPFTIDEADKGQVVGFSFDFLDSANFATEDIVCFVYDITNSNLISVNAGIGLQAGTGRFAGSFQAAIDSTSYRIIVHIASTNATAYTLKLDNLQIGPDATGTTQYKENVYSAKFVNNGTVSILSQSSTEDPAIASISRSSTGNGTVTFTSGFFSEAPSVVSQVNKVSDSTTMHQISITSVTTSGFTWLTNADASDSRSYIDADFTVTIQRQGDDYQVNTSSSSASGRIESAVFDTHAGYGSTATKVPYYTNVRSNITGGLISISNESVNGFVVTAQQDCEITLTRSVKVTTATFSGISLNSTNVGTNVSALSSPELLASEYTTASGQTSTVAVTYKMTKGDFIMPHDDGASNGNFSNMLIVASNGVQTNQSEVAVYVDGVGNGGGAISVGATDIDFTETEDSSGTFNGTQFTAPVDGRYLVTGVVVPNAAVALNINAYIDTSFTKGLSGNVSTNRHAFSGQITLLKGEVLSLRTGFAGCTLSNVAEHHLSITKL